MAGNIRFTGYLSAGNSIGGTIADSLNSTYISALSSEIDNSSNLYVYGDFELVLGSLTPTSTAVGLYIVRSVDNTNYPEWPTGAAPVDANRKHYVDAFLVTTGTGAKRSVCRGVLLPPCKFKVAISNSLGVITASSGNTLKVSYYSDYYV